MVVMEELLARLLEQLRNLYWRTCGSVVQLEATKNNMESAAELLIKTTSLI
jgi:hypothetical protein